MLYFSLSSFPHAPYTYLNLFPSSTPLSYNLFHRDPLTFKKCSMNSWVFSSTFASLENDMDHAHVSYISCTMFLSLEKGLVALFPCTTRKLSTHSCSILLTSMWYTKQLLFSLYPYSTLVEIGGSSDPPLSPIVGFFF
jgi:hypothetical protein